MIEDEYGIKTNPAPPKNPQENSPIKRINQVLGNLVHKYNLQEAYVDDADPCMGIFAATAFAVRSTYHIPKEKITFQLVFGRYIIIPINNVSDWRYIRLCKHTQINKDVNRENTTIID